MVYEFNYIKCSNFKLCIIFILLWAYLSFGEACDSICGSLPTWHDGFLALMALGGIFIGVALWAEEPFILGGEGFVHQWAFALETLETILMPVAVLVGQILQKTADRQLTLGRLKLTQRAHPARLHLLWSYSRWASCIPRRCWSTGSHNISHSMGSPLSGHTSSQTGTPCNSGSHSARSFWPKGTHLRERISERSESILSKVSNFMQTVKQLCLDGWQNICAGMNYKQLMSSRTRSLTSSFMLLGVSASYFSTFIFPSHLSTVLHSVLQPGAEGDRWEGYK